MRLAYGLAICSAPLLVVFACDEAPSVGPSHIFGDPDAADTPDTAMAADTSKPPPDSGAQDSGNDAASDAPVVDTGVDAGMCVLTSMIKGGKDCKSCLQTNCCDDTNTCAGTSDCQTIIDCINACDPDASADGGESVSCELACIQGYPSDIKSAAVNYLVCTQSTCAGACM